MAKYKPTSKEERLATHWDLAMKNYDPTSLYPNPQKQSMFQVSGFDIEDFKSLKDPDPMKGFGALVEERAQNQSTADKWGNAALKMGITAGTTFLDGTVGTIAGLANMAIEGEGSAFWNNGVSKYFAGLQDWSEDVLPNYYTQAELERPWYENMITANFWADKVLKNMGFMIGTVASSMLYSGGVRSALGAKDIANRVGKGLMGKALKNGKIISSADEGLAAYLRGEVSGAEIVEELARDAKLLRGIDAASQMIGSVAGSVGEARIEALQGVKEYAEKRKLENPNISDEELQKELTDIGNSIFLTNMAVLSVGNYAQFRNAIGGGYTPNKLDFSNLIKGGYKEGFKSAIPEGKLGKVAFQTGQVVKSLKNPLWEGMEEQLQKVGQEASTEFFGKGQDENTEDIFAGYLNKFASKLGEQFGSIDNWEEFAIGFISGGLGAPTIKGKTPIIAGGVWDEIKTQRARVKQVKDIVEAANKSSERIKDVKNHALRSLAISADKQQALENGDKFSWLNVDNAEIVNDITLASQLGRLEEFKDELRAKQNISSEEIQAFFSKEIGDKVENRYKNKSESEIKQEVSDRINKVIGVADRIQKTVDNLKIKFPTLSNEVINEIAYYEATEEDLNKRSNDIANKLTELTKLLDGRNAQEIAQYKAQQLEISNAIRTSKENMKKTLTTLNEIVNNNFDNSVEIKSKINQLEKSKEKLSEINKEQTSLEQELNDLIYNTKEPTGKRKSAKKVLNSLNNTMSLITARIEELKYEKENIEKESSNTDNIILEARREENKRLTDEYIKNLDLLEATKEQLTLFENEENLQRQKVVEKLGDKTGIAYEEYLDSINSLLDKNEKLNKELKELYDYKPNLKEDVDTLLKDLSKVERRKRYFIARIAAAYSTNGVKDIQDAINRFEDDKKEKKNNKLFDSTFTNGVLVRDTVEGKDYKVLEINGKKYLYEKNDEGNWTKQTREFVYTKGVNERYKTIDQIAQQLQAQVKAQPKEETTNDIPKDVRYDNEEIIDTRENKQYEFDSNPKRVLGVNGTVGNIGEVKDNEIKLTQDDDVIRFQNFLDTHSVDQFKGKPVSGSVLFGDKWATKKKELEELGYANPDQHLWVVITDNNGNEIKDGDNTIFTSLAVSYLYTPLRSDGELVKASSLKKEDFKPNELILTRNKKGQFTSEAWEEATGEKLGISMGYDRLFNSKVEVLKYNFAINKKYEGTKAIQEETAHQDLLKEPPKVLNFSHKTRGIALLQDKEYNITEYLTDNKLNKDQVDLKVSIDGTIQAFGTSYVVRKGFTYLIDRKNGRIIQVKPRKLTVEEQSLVVNLLKTYCSKSTLKEDGKIDTTGANILEMEDGTMLEGGIVETLNRLIGFNTGTNNTTNKETEKTIIDLNNRIRSLGKKEKTKKNVEEYNKLIKELEEHYKKLSTHSRSIYFQSNFHDRETPPGGFIVIGFKNGKPNAVPLFKMVNEKVTNEISDIALSELNTFLKDKWHNVKNRDIDNQSGDSYTIPTEIVNGKVTRFITYNGKDGYKRMLLGDKPDTGVAPKPILQTRQAKEIKGYRDGREYEGKLPTAANRYLVIENNQQKVDKPTSENITKVEQSNNIETKKADIERRRPTSYIKYSKDKKSSLETFRNEAKREWDGVSVITGDRMKNLYVGIQLFVEAYPEHKELLDKFIKKENGTIGITNNNLSFVLNTLKKQGITTESELSGKINAKYDAELKALEKEAPKQQAQQKNVSKKSEEKLDKMFGEDPTKGMTKEELEAMRQEAAEMRSKPETVIQETKPVEKVTKSIDSLNPDEFGVNEIVEPTVDIAVDYMANPEKLYNENKEYIKEAGFDTLEDFMESFNESKPEDKKSFIDDVINNC